MPVDVDARVLSNTRLSPHYNVLAIEAPEIAELGQPGQFLMVKPARGNDPLLRRPFSIFEVLRNEDSSPVGVSLLNKQIGVGTRLIYELEPGDRIACLGPLGRPFTPVEPPALAWMVAGGVGLAPFATLATRLRSLGTETMLFYGGRSGSDLYHLPFFERLGVQLVLTTEDGSVGEPGYVTQPLERAFAVCDTTRDLTLYVCGPTPMMRAVARLASRFDRPAQMSLEQVMGCGLGGCYSCVVAVRQGGREAHFVRSCIEGPVFASDTIAWELLEHA